MTKDSPEVERALSGFDESKRRTLIRLLHGAAFAVPIVASFSMDGLTISEVHALNSDHPNSTDFKDVKKDFKDFKDKKKHKQQKQQKQQNQKRKRDHD